MITDTALPSVLLHGGFLLFLLAYGLRDILWLRTVTVVGYVFFSVLCVIRGGPSVVELLPWYVAFMALNAVQMVRLVRERWIVKLSAEEERLWANGYDALDRVVFKRFLRFGQWRSPTEGQALTNEGKRSSRLYLIYEGAVEVTLSGRPVTRLGPGQFVGEIGFIADRPSTATATVLGADDNGMGARCVVWNVPKLRRQMGRDGELKSLVFAAVGSDLSRKIADQTVVAQRQPEVAGGSVSAAPLAAGP